MKLETKRSEPLTILEAAVVYFALVFGTGVRSWPYSNPVSRSTFRRARGRVDGSSHNAHRHPIGSEMVGSKVSTNSSRVVSGFPRAGFDDCV